MHRSPHSAARLILIEEMVFIVEEHQTVRVVHPVGLGSEMEEWTVVFAL
jgi:hypothetical protein